MQEIRSLEQKTTSIVDPPKIKKKIGKTTYEVSLYFSKTSTENVQDKLKRIILSEYFSLK